MNKCNIVILMLYQEIFFSLKAGDIENEYD